MSQKVPILRMRGQRVWPVFALATALLPSVTHAKPSGPVIVCEAYPEFPQCLGTVPECTMCHTSTDPVGWNAYGGALIGSFGGLSFDEGLGAAMAAIASEDADGDGVLNIDELEQGTEPGTAEAFTCEGPRSYSPEVAYRRVAAIYCGRSPTFDELEMVRGSETTVATELVHEKLNTCLASDYWKDVGLARIADRFVTPIESVGLESPVGITIGDYQWDYNLFRYAMSDDRDARELLLATYHVSDEGGTFSKVEGPFESPIGGAGGQPLAPEHRAGMLTTQWYLARNTMFTALPRTTAANAYRLYLGLDIGLQEGIWPISSEPSDIDNKGVSEPTCAQCHSTLDPLSYAFTNYVGIAGRFTGVYSDARPAEVIEGWNDPESYILGTPVASVVEWAEVAANSDQFARATAMTMFEHALGREPTAMESVEFEQVWRGFAEQGWSVNAMLHDMIDLPAFGGGR